MIKIPYQVFSNQAVPIFFWMQKLYLLKKLLNGTAFTKEVANFITKLSFINTRVSWDSHELTQEHIYMHRLYHDRVVQTLYYKGVPFRGCYLTSSKQKMLYMHNLNTSRMRSLVFCLIVLFTDQHPSSHERDYWHLSRYKGAVCPASMHPWN